MIFPVLTVHKMPPTHHKLFIFTFNKSVWISLPSSSAFPECFNIFSHVYPSTLFLSPSQKMLPHATEK